MKLYATVLGEGKPFLILHGFLGMSDNWKTLGNKFADDGYQVHLIDQRNHGKSPHSNEFNYDLLVGDIREYCNDHSLSNILLLGHSMGGKAAMLTAFNHPELVEKLIVVDIAPKYYAPQHQDILEGLTALEEANLTSRSDAEDLLSQFVPHKGIQLFLLKNLYWRTKEKLALKINLESLKENIDKLSEALPNDKSFDKPSLFIRGEDSDYITAQDEKNIMEQFPKADIVSISGAGHWVHAENQKDFYRNVKSFL